MGVFSRVFKSRDAGSRSQSALASRNQPAPAQKQVWEDAWTRKDVAADEVEELLNVCTQEMKSRALDMPFLLLPFRPNSDANAAKSFIRNYFKDRRSTQYTGAGLRHELKITEPMILCSIMKWAWSRLSGGVVGWDTYELFKQGEHESQMAKHAFDTFIPLSVESDARKNIIFDFFELLAAIAANGKTNGLGGRKLSRLAGWWAFAHSDNGKGFEGGYKSWANAADATSHLFFAYLRSLAPESVIGSTVSKLPRSLQALLAQTEYPPETPSLLLTRTSKVVMLVNSVSPTPFALLRRARNFDYRDDDRALRAFSDYEDPVKALTSECRRVLDSISSTNSTGRALPELTLTSSTSPSSGNDASWSQFEDVGFSSLLDGNSSSYPKTSRADAVRQSGKSGFVDLGRPTTPSWADFLSSGFTDDTKNAPSAYLLPPGQLLPAISPGRVQSSQSHVKGMREDNLEPGELASVNVLDVDETFWWVWMTSLAGEEPAFRKAVFGRCAFVETDISGGRWLVVEEQIRGGVTQPDPTAVIVEKKSRFSTFGRDRTRRQSTGKRPPVPNAPYQNKNSAIPQSKTTIGPDQQARVQAAAAALVQKQKDDELEKIGRRRGRTNEQDEVKTQSVMTLQPVIMKEAGPAMQWAKKFDKEAIRDQYLGDNMAGKGFGYRHTPNASSLNLPTALSAGDATALAQKADVSAESPLPPAKDTPPMMVDEEPPAKQTSSMDFVQFLKENATVVPNNKFPVASDRKPFASTANASTANAPTTNAPTANAPTANESTIADDTGAYANGSVSKSKFNRKAVDSVDSTSNPKHASQGASVFHSARESTDQQKPPSTPKQVTTAAAAAVAAATAWHSANSSPESGTKYPKRKESTRGFKGIFNRRKTQAPETVATNGAANGSSMSVEKPLVRKSSLLRRKPASAVEETAAPTSAPRNVPTTEPAESTMDFANMDEGEPGPELTTDTPDFENMHEPVSHEPTNPYNSTDYTSAAYPSGPYVPAPYSTRNANDSSAQFSNFSQGPMDDVPAFVPEDDSAAERSITPPAPAPAPAPVPVQAPPKAPTQESYQPRVASLLQKNNQVPEPQIIRPAPSRQAPTPEFTTPMERLDTNPMEQRRFPIATPSPTSGERSPLTPVVAGVQRPSQRERPTEVKVETAADRWAAIRQNAAVRKNNEEAAGRTRNQSQSQSITTEKTDDGETSGEETIESRVARIKARVAELTGGQTIPART